MSVRPHPTKDPNWWIIDFYLQGRKGKSLKYITEYGWAAERLEAFLELTSEQLAEMDTLSKSVYRKAEADGISACFEAWPKKARPGVYSVESLHMPPKKNG